MSGTHPTRKPATDVKRHTILLLLSFLVFILVATQGAYSAEPEIESVAQTRSDEFLIVDCLLPGQVRKLGQRMNYISPRRPIKTSATDCAIRGGEYVSYDRANYGTALKIWLPLAQEGNPEAQTYVGEIYEKGLGLEPDYQVAAHWYQKAVNQNYSRAAVNLGNLYESGLGVERDQRKALNLYRLASGIGNDELLFASSLVATHVPKENFDALQTELTAEKKQSTRLKSDISRLNKEILKSTTELASAEKELEATATKLANLTESVPTISPEGEQGETEKQLSADYKKLQAEKEELAEQLTALQNRNQDLQSSRDKLSKTLSEKEKVQNSYRNQLAQLQNEVTESQQQLSKSEQAVGRLQAQLNIQQADQSSSKQSIANLQRELNKKNRQLEQEKQRFAQLELVNTKKQQDIEKAAANVEQQVQRFDTEKESFQLQEKRLTKQLEQNQQRLKDAEHRLLIAKAALQLERSKNNQTARSDNSTAAKQAKAEREQRLQRLTQKLTEQSRLVSEQKDKIKSLETQASAAQKDEAPAPILLADNSAPPMIEIIEPPVALQRSIPEVKLNSVTGEQEIVGKVTAETGVLSFTINGEPVKLGKNNLFTAKVKVNDTPERINIVVVDKVGRRAAAIFNFIGPAARGEKLQIAKQQPLTPPKKVKLNISAKEFGEYHALIIGNNNYRHFSTLVTAVNDAKETEKLLRDRYNFKTHLLLDADRYSILSKLNELRESLGEQDNLLIYYAGHGVLNSERSQGYWLPVDAYPDDDVNWISNSAITEILNAIKAKHILVVADSCFSGTLTQTPLARVQEDIPNNVREQWIKVMADTRARITLTSGGLEPVRDDGGKDHSLFATAFLDALRSNEDVMEGYSLYYQIMLRMSASEATSKATDAVQVPQYSPIHLAGHESGEFFFTPI